MTTCLYYYRYERNSLFQQAMYLVEFLHSYKILIFNLMKWNGIFKIFL